jgi:hypothetical protein
MAITDKTRKTLWARSGNRCLLCRIELVQQTEAMAGNVIVGEECHIISSSAHGPRGSIPYEDDYDGHANLILLCANDHKRVDELTDIYTAETLILFKLVHEEWVRTTLERDVIAFANDKQNVKSLPKITSGMQIVDIINGAHMFDFTHYELKTEQEAGEIGGLFEELQETADFFSEMGYAETAKFGIRMNEEVEKLKQMGFVLFGMRRKLRLRNAKKEDMGVYDTATLIAVRQDNPSIVGNFLIAKFPTNANVSLGF